MNDYRCPLGNSLESCSCSCCFGEKQTQAARLMLKKAEAANFSSGSSIGNITRSEKPPAPQITVKERLAKQRLQNAESSDQTWEMVQARKTQTQMPANSMYWPPYDHTAPDGEKDIKIQYLAPVSIALMSLEEAKEFYANMGGKDTIGDARNYKGLALNSLSAYDVAIGLGGLGVKARTQTINGVDWIIIKDYRKHLKTIEKGHKWSAKNPRIIELGLGLNDIKGSMRYVKINAGIEIAFAVGVNAVDYLLRDEATLAELGVNMAGDVVKGFISLAGAALVTATIPATAGVLVTGVFFAGASFGFGVLLNELDKKFEYSKDFQKVVEDYFQ